MNAAYIETTLRPLMKEAYSKKDKSAIPTLQAELCQYLRMWSNTPAWHNNADGNLFLTMDQTIVSNFFILPYILTNNKTKGVT